MQDKFYNACKQSNYEYMEKILSEESYDTKGAYNNPFIIACSAGNLQSVKYLLNKFGLNNNIDKWGDYGFRWACSSGNLDLVKYLLEIRPEINISSNNDVAFRWACEANQLSVVKWFQQQNPEIYDFEIVNKTNRKIVSPGIQNTRRQKASNTLKTLVSECDS